MEPLLLRETIAPMFVALFLKAPECTTLSRSLKPSLWLNARQEESSLYCKTIHLGLQAIRQQHWIKALELAQHAERLQPKQVSYLVLRGLALSHHATKSNEAIQNFEAAYSRNTLVFSDIDVLDAYGLALIHAKQFERALQIYHQLLPRLSSLETTCSFELCPSLGFVYTTVAFLYLKLNPHAVADALATLREGYKRPQSKDSKELLTASLALMLSRTGEPDEARRLSQRLCMTECLTSSTVRERIVEPNEFLALQAFALEQHHAANAKKLWQEYVHNTDPKHPWAQHAKERIYTLEANPKKLTTR